MHTCIQPHGFDRAYTLLQCSRACAGSTEGHPTRRLEQCSQAYDLAWLPKEHVPFHLPALLPCRELKSSSAYLSEVKYNPLSLHFELSMLSIFFIAFTYSSRVEHTKPVSSVTISFSPPSWLTMHGLPDKSASTAT